MSDKIKVCWTTSLGGSSGAPPQAELLAEKLSERDIEVTLVHAPPLGIEHKDPYIEADVDGDFRAVYPTKSLARCVEAPNIMPDMVMIHSFNISVVQDLGRLRANYPVFMRLGINLLELLMMPQYHEMLPVVVNTIKAVDHVVAASRNTGLQVRSLGEKGEKQVTVIHTAVDPERHKPVEISDTPTVTFLGRLYPVKNPLTLIQAFNLVKEKMPEAELALAGPNADLGEYIDAILKQMGHESGVDYKFTGYMENLDLLFKETRVLALPSFSENNPQAVLQAYAYGVPCVVSDCGWGREFRACAHAPHDAPHKWAEKIYTLLSSESEWRVFRDRQQRELEKHFNLQDILDQYEDLFRTYHRRESYLAGQEDSVKKRLRELGVRVREREGEGEE